MSHYEETRFGDVTEVARLTGISVSTLNKHRVYHPDLSPPFAKVGHRVVYPLTGPNSVATWMEQRIVNREIAA